jgi:2-polyprenyl-3-methyl-5-hydroxy-6-metoxy-1,4-benzoquinol methylase
VRSHIPQGARILDVGSNCGQLAINLSQDGWGCDVTGIDVIRDFVDYANEQGVGTFHCGDFGALSATEVNQLCRDDGRNIRRFDVITALEVIEHDLSLRGFLGRAWYVLKPGGKVIVTTPHPDGITGYALVGKEAAHVRVWTRWRLEMAFGPFFGCPIDYQDIYRDECGRLLSMGVVWQKEDPWQLQNGRNGRER